MLAPAGSWEALVAAVPDVPLHASTQMSLHTLSGVTKAASPGLTRAVLARELSRDEIAELCAECPIELEAFVHGALCFCYSGQCEMSAVIGRRKPRAVRAWTLSLKDASLADYVSDLQDLGVACLMLEGRMKRPEYVAAVTMICASAGRRRTTNAHSSTPLSRGGFTDGCYTGKKGAPMFGARVAEERWPEEWFAALRAQYEKENLRTVPVRFTARVVKVSGPAPKAARNRAVTTEEVETRLRKAGGTAFARLRFTTETADERAAALRAHVEGRDRVPEYLTRGLFYRGAG